jgi:hypothetical protein
LIGDELTNMSEILFSSFNGYSYFFKKRIVPYNENVLKGKNIAL